MRRELFGSIAARRPSRGQGQRHAIVLAGGDGTRLAGVAERLYGYARPKQFCRFGAERTLLEETLQRACRFTGSPSRIVASVNRAHRAETDECLAAWSRVDRVEQPRNLDTAPGILLPLRRILEKDPFATVLVLPSDHHVSDDDAFVDAMVEALPGLEEDPEAVVLAGARLAAPEPDLGWIVPGAPMAHWRKIVAFVEKPPPHEAAALHASGALANTFVLVARATALAKLAQEQVPHWWNALSDAGNDRHALESVYRRMPPASFTRDILERAPRRLGVVALESVVWSDIGTPDRLEAVRGARAVAA